MTERNTALEAELFRAFEEVGASRRPEEMFEALVRRLGPALGASHCACLVPSSDRRYGRIVAVHEDPSLHNLSVDLFHYPEVVEAMVTGAAVFAPEVLRHKLFLTHLAQWPDAPEVHEVESSVAVPLFAHGMVRAVLVLRTRRGDPALTLEQVGHLETIGRATSALLATRQAA